MKHFASKLIISAVSSSTTQSGFPLHLKC